MCLIPKNERRAYEVLLPDYDNQSENPLMGLVGPAIVAPIITTTGFSDAFYFGLSRTVTLSIVNRSPSGSQIALKNCSAVAFSTSMLIR